jgi:hypothetical protein
MGGQDSNGVASQQQWRGFEAMHAYHRLVGPRVSDSPCKVDVPESVMRSQTFETHIGTYVINTFCMGGVAAEACEKSHSN